MTIKDIAKLSGCGVATVSRVINNYPDVSPETRRRVLDVLEEYNFQPNSNARRLKQQTGQRVAVFVKGNHNMLFAEMVEQIQQRMRTGGVDTAVYYLDEEGVRRYCEVQTGLVADRMVEIISGLNEGDSVIEG